MKFQQIWLRLCCHLPSISRSGLVSKCCTAIMHPLPCTEPPNRAKLILTDCPCMSSWWVGTWRYYNTRREGGGPEQARDLWYILQQATRTLYTSGRVDPQSLYPRRMEARVPKSSDFSLPATKGECLHVEHQVSGLVPLSEVGIAQKQTLKWEFSASSLFGRKSWEVPLEESRNEAGQGSQPIQAAGGIRTLVWAPEDQACWALWKTAQNMAQSHSTLGTGMRA